MLSYVFYIGYMNNGHENLVMQLDLVSEEYIHARFLFFIFRNKLFNQKHLVIPLFQQQPS